MAMFDINFFLLIISALITTAIGSNATTVGNVVNMNDVNDFEAVVFALIVGAYTDGNFQLIIEDSDDGIVFALVTADNLLGDGALLATAAESVLQLGYAGKKQFVRASVISTGVTSGATVTVAAVQGKPRNTPIV